MFECISDTQLSLISVIMFVWVIMGKQTVSIQNADLKTQAGIVMLS